MQEDDGRIVIVTGASRGLGAAAVEALRQLGARVALTARSEEDLEAVAARVDPSDEATLVVAGDVSEPDECRRIVEETVAHFGRLDGLVNNAGVLQPMARLADVDVSAWRHNLAVNLLGPFYLAQAAIPHLRWTKGRVIHVSSGAAIRAIEGWSAYCVSKAGLNQLSRAIAAEEPDIISIALRPGVVDTAMQAAIREEGEKAMDDESHERFVHLHETGELLSPEEPARALAALTLYAPHDWSGEFVEWNADKVATLVEESF